MTSNAEFMSRKRDEKGNSMLQTSNPNPIIETQTKLSLIMHHPALKYFCLTDKFSVLFREFDHQLHMAYITDEIKAVQKIQDQFIECLREILCP